MSRFKWEPEVLEYGRKYVWRPEYLQHLQMYLSVDPGGIVMDVGCGTGFFTRLISRKLKGGNIVIGIDVDTKVLRAAKTLALKESLSTTISFLRASAYHLPLLKNSVHLVFCHGLFSTLDKPFKALREIVSVAKHGARVVASEPDARANVFYDQNNNRYIKLRRKFDSSYVKGWKKLCGGDLFIGSKLAGMFIKAGLEDIIFDGHLIMAPPCDARYSTREISEYLNWSILQLRKEKENIKSIILKGGMSPDEFEEYWTKTLERIKTLIKDPQKIKTTSYVQAFGRFIVVGKKPIFTQL